LSDMFPVKDGGDALFPLLFYFALEYAIRRERHPLGRPRHSWEDNIMMDL